MYFLLFGLFALGIATQTVFTLTLPTITWLFVLSLVLVIVHARNESCSPARFTMLGLMLAVFAVGLLRMEVYAQQFANSAFDSLVGEETIFSGIVVQEPDVRNRNQHLYVRSAEELVLVSVSKYENIGYGDEVVISGTIQKPESFETDLGRTFDYPGYLLARGVTHKVDFAEVVVIQSNQANAVVGFLLDQKKRLMNAMESVITEPQVGLAEGLLLGVKQALGDDIEESFRKSGIIHIVVLSGYNVMLVVAFILYVLSFFFKKRLRILVGIIGIIAFALIVGLSATVVRASIMASLFLFASLFTRSYDVLRALFLAGAIMIFINPYILIYDIGFQLSFMATLGLILVAPHFEQTVASSPVSLNLKSYFIATVATQIAVLPLLLYHIGEISIVAVLVNVLVLPVVPVAMLLSFIAGVAALFSTAMALPIAFLSEMTLTYIIVIATWFAALPIATVTVPQFSPYLIGVFYIVIGVVLFLWNRKDNRVSTTLIGWEIVDESTIKKDVPELGTSSLEPPIFFR